LVLLVVAGHAYAFPRGGGAPATGGVATPVLIQHVASSANPVGLGISGNNFKIPLPNPVLAGDALVPGIAYPHGATVTISDTLSQTWPSAAATADNGSGNYISAVYVLANSLGGNETITVGFGSAVIPFNVQLYPQRVQQHRHIVVGQRHEGRCWACSRTQAAVDPTITSTVTPQMTSTRCRWRSR